MASLRGPRQPGGVKQDLAPQVGERVPEGQFVTDKFPVLTYGPAPRVEMSAWRFQVFGLVEREMEWTWEDICSMPQVAVTADFHCVTQWSRLDNAWEGVSARALLEKARPLSQALYVMAHCYGGYTTNLSLAAIMEGDVILAYRQDGKPLAPEHGGPLRLVVPRRYGWKSAKWVKGLELIEEDRPGFWEQRGYHMRGDPWREERFWPELS